MNNNFKENELIIYQNGERFEIGRIKRLTEDGAFVYYHSGDTAAKTPFDCMHKLENSYCIGFTNLGGGYPRQYVIKNELTSDLKKQLKDALCYPSIFAVDNLSITPLDKWIPVSERLPDDNEYVLVTYNHEGQNIVDFLRFNLPNKWEESFGEYEIDNVIAWMPLPEPYKE